MPIVSIVVPVYNVEQYLEYCVASLKQQTLKNIEIILVDDGSPDNSGKICDELAKTDERITVIHKENGGLSSARNAGIKAARGKYIGFVDSDDWIEPDMYENLLNLIESHDADIADCDMIETAERAYVTNEQTQEIEVLSQKDALNIFFRITKANINYCVCDKLFKKELFDKVQFTEGIIFEDIDFNFRVLLHVNRVVNTNAPHYYYFKNPEGISRNSLREKDLELLKVWDNIVGWSKEQLPEYVTHAEFNRKRADFGLLCKMFKYGTRNDGTDYAEIRKNLLKSIRKNYFSLMKGKLPVNRKILLTLMAINYRLVEWPLRIRRKLM